jgi:hypothetical protein
MLVADVLKISDVISMLTFSVLPFLHFTVFSGVNMLEKKDETTEDLKLIWVTLQVLKK